MKSNVSLSVSLPFVGGVAIAAFALVGIAPWWLISEISLGFWAAALVACTIGKGRIEWALRIMLLCCGAFCYSSRAIVGEMGFTGPEWAVARVRDLIDSIGFRGQQTGALLDALLTGDRSMLPKDTTAIFRQSGASHLLALSGLHLGILAGLVNTVMRVLGNSRKAEAARLTSVVVFSGFYTLMCGSTPSLVRAFLFIVLSSVARFFPGRRPEKGGILCSAITIQLAFDPLAISSLAFQMSYLAVVGIVFIQPRFESWYPSDGGKLDPMRRLWSMLSLGISCQLTTAPLVWLRFKTFPTYFLLTNLLAMPLCEILIVSAVVLLIVTAMNGSASGLIPEALIWVVDNLSDLMLGILETISSMQTT